MLSAHPGNPAVKPCLSCHPHVPVVLQSQTLITLPGEEEVTYVRSVPERLLWSGEGTWGSLFSFTIAEENRSPAAATSPDMLRLRLISETGLVASHLYHLTDWHKKWVEKILKKAFSLEVNVFCLARI